MGNAENRIGVGICGLGFMGRTQFAYWREHERARVVAVCDQDPARRAGCWDAGTGNIGARAGERVDLSGIRAYADAVELIKDKAVDVVVITLPTPLHADLTVRALRAGKHVFCEKPMALTVRDCDRMVRAAEKSGRTLLIGQCIRFWPQYEVVKRMVDSGKIGAVRSVSLRRLASAPGWSQGGWLMDGSQSGGALLDLHVHDVDYAHYLLGVPERLSAVGRRGPSGEIDHVVATHRYADGRYALIEGGWTFRAPWPFEMAVTVQGERGTLDWSMMRGTDVLHYDGGAEPQRIVVSERNGWLRELDYFISCIINGKPALRCTPQSSRTSIALALLERRSIERGRPVAVPESLRRAK